MYNELFLMLGQFTSVLLVRLEFERFLPHPDAVAHCAPLITTTRHEHNVAVGSEDYGLDG